MRSALYTSEWVAKQDVVEKFSSFPDIHLYSFLRSNSGIWLIAFWIVFAFFFRVNYVVLKFILFQYRSQASVRIRFLVSAFLTFLSSIIYLVWEELEKFFNQDLLPGLIKRKTFFYYISNVFNFRCHIEACSSY